LDRADLGIPPNGRTAIFVRFAGRWIDALSDAFIECRAGDAQSLKDGFEAHRPTNFL
jgi:hypothetical protein